MAGDVDEPWGGVLPEEPLPVRLMNTIWADRHGVHDVLLRPRDLSAWLAATGLAAGTPHVEPADLDRARALRDALRRIAALVSADDRPAAASAIHNLPDAVAEVNAAAERGLVPPRLQWVDGVLGRLVEPGGPSVATALSELATQSMELLVGGSAPELRACHAPGCVLYFVKDHPRREWCSTACGNRARAARHYRRHRLDQSAPDG